MEIPKVSDARELLDKLGWIGTTKLDIPLNTRWRLNELGLYVQLHYAGGQGRLQAGGKYKSYFDAWGPEGGDASLWKVKRFDENTWNRRFAHLVWPTYEVALFFIWWRDEAFCEEPDTATLEHVRKHYDTKIREAISHFRTTGEWLGILEWKCSACKEALFVWQLSNETCPHCGTKRPHTVPQYERAKP